MVGGNLPLQSVLQGCKESASLILDELDSPLGATIGGALTDVAVLGHCHLSRLWLKVGAGLFIKIISKISKLELLLVGFVDIWVALDI